MRNLKIVREIEKEGAVTILQSKLCRSNGSLSVKTPKTI